MRLVTTLSSASSNTPAFEVPRVYSPALTHAPAFDSTRYCALSPAISGATEQSAMLSK